MIPENEISKYPDAGKVLRITSNEPFFRGAGLGNRFKLIWSFIQNKILHENSLIVARLLISLNVIWNAIYYFVWNFFRNKFSLEFYLGIIYYLIIEPQYKPNTRILIEIFKTENSTKNLIKNQ